MKNRLSSHERDSVQSWVTNIVNAVNTSVPVAVQIEPIDLTWLPLPDGRLWTTKIEPAAEYVDDCTFVDRDGMILSIPNDPQFTGSGTSLIYNSILSWILSGRGASVISQDHAPSPHASPSATRGIAP